MHCLYFEIASTKQWAIYMAGNGSLQDLFTKHSAIDLENSANTIRVKRRVSNLVKVRDACLCQDKCIRWMRNTIVQLNIYLLNQQISHCLIKKGLISENDSFSTTHNKCYLVNNSHYKHK